MKNYGIGTLNDFLEDRIVYRNLNPCVDYLPTYKELVGQKPSENFQIPRKTELNYADAIVKYIHFANQKKYRENSQIKSLIYIGDTLMNDGGAFQNIIKLSGWDGYCFICDEDQKPTSLQKVISEFGNLYQSNRWCQISEFKSTFSNEGILLDDSAVLLMDMDKTMVGARGRNDHVIDGVRLEAAMKILNEVLKIENNDSKFYEIYKLFNGPDYHHFTKDNQDYLVYICIFIQAGIVEEKSLAQNAKDSDYQLQNFIQLVQNNYSNLPSNLKELHISFLEKFNAGDPTPFKQFRRAEYIVTSEKFSSSQEVPIDEIINSKIVITNEVYSFAKNALLEGCLTFGLSDKPDEASIPTDEQQNEGKKALHQLSTILIGDEGEGK